MTYSYFLIFFGEKQKKKKIIFDYEFYSISEIIDYVVCFSSSVHFE